MKNLKITIYFAFKGKNEMSAVVLGQKSKVTELYIHTVYHLEDDGITKGVTLFRDFYWLLRKSLLQWGNRQFSDCFYFDNGM